MADIPPQPISQDSIVIVRSVDPGTGYVITKYVDKTTGLEVGLAPTHHLMKQNAGFIPPPS